MSGGSDDDGIGLGDCLGARSDVRRVTEREILVLPCFTDLSDDHEAGVDAEAHGEAHVSFFPETEWFSIAMLLDDPQRRPHRRALRVVLVGHWIAEVREDAIAQILGECDRR